MEKNTTLDELTAANADMVLAEFRIKRAVTAAVGAGASWTEIGAKLGISKQTAHARYSRTVAALSTPEAADDVQGPSITPSIFSDEPAPAKTKTASKKSDPNGPAVKGKMLSPTGQVVDYATNGRPLRPGRKIPGEIPTQAEPGIGTGAQACISCGKNNHKGVTPQYAYFYNDCAPTRYDPPYIANFIKGTNR